MSVLAEKLVLWFQVNFDPPLNDRGVLKAEDWAEICRLHRAEGMAIRAIARRPEISRNAVKKAVTSHEPPRYVRAGAGSAVDGFEPQVRALLAEFPEMPTSVIMERVGWADGKTVSCERVAQLRPLFQPADVPLGWGQAARPPVLVMVSGYSRMIAAVMIPTRAAPDLLAGHWHLISGQARRVYGGGGWLAPFPAVRRRDHRLDGDVNDGCGSGVNIRHDCHQGGTGAPMTVPTAVITAARLMVSLGGRRRAGLFLVQREQLGGNAGLDHQFHAPAGGVPLGAVGVVTARANATQVALLLREASYRATMAMSLSRIAVRSASGSLTCD